MIQEGIYLFFESEITDKDDPFHCADLSDRFLREIKRIFMMDAFDQAEVDELAAELRPLNERKFNQCCKQIKAVSFIPIRSFFELESALGQSPEIADDLRDAIFNNGLLFALENWDVSCFWTGGSVKRWFKARFPAKPPEKIKYAKPPTVLDLLYEFLESVSRCHDNLLALKETLSVLSKEDRLFVEGILSGNNPKNSEKTQEISARILHALLDRKGR